MASLRQVIKHLLSNSSPADGLIVAFCLRYCLPCIDPCHTFGAHTAHSWDEVTTCSKRCNAERRRRQKHASSQSDSSSTSGDSVGSTPGQKPCTLCAKPTNLLVRCQTDASRKWEMVCGSCWKTVSGGVPDGDASHPFYTYGGLWKNRR